MESKTPRDCGCMTYGIGTEFIDELVDRLRDCGQTTICGIGSVSWEVDSERLVIQLAPDLRKKLEAPLDELIAKTAHHRLVDRVLENRQNDGITG